ncbi:MAG TPA: sialidase family protein [Clostridia bacterium]
MIIADKEELKKFYSNNRKWQGIPSIERTQKGRLFAAFYSGGAGEQLGNFIVLLKSDDDGLTWSEPITAVYRGEDYRCFDQCLWIDPLGRLWLIWGVQPEYKLYASICENPDQDELEWSDYFVIGGEVMMNKPTVLSTGEWLFPIAVWAKGVESVRGLASNEEDRRIFVYATEDCGKTFAKRGGTDCADRIFDEHMILERKDGSLLMYIRTKGNIAQSVSYDRGYTWTYGEDSGIKSPSARFCLKRLKSGNVLFINHYNFTGRNNLTAMISKDDCKTFEGFLTIDERDNVSYPDAVEDDEGNIYIIYDRERGRTYVNKPDPAREILLAKITEQDILAGKLVAKTSRLKNIVSKL